MPRKDGFGDFHEITIIPGWTTPKATYDRVDLSVELAPGLVLSYPFIAAAMTSVVGKEMAIECARNGIMAVVPSQLSIKEAGDIVRSVKKQEVKKGDLEFNEQPEWITDFNSIGDAVKRYEEVGHSVIPICDDYRKLKGLFLYQEGIPRDFFDINLCDAITMARQRKFGMSKIIKPFDLKKAKRGEDYFSDKDSQRKMHDRLKKGDKRCMPVVDSDGSLKGLAFIYKHNGYAVGGAIHTYNWRERAEALLEAGVDAIFIDSSDGASDFMVRTIRKFKKLSPDTPLCAGNIVAGKAKMKNRKGEVTEVDVYDKLVDAGADMLKIGMGTGRICLTTENRGVGRLLMRALEDLYETRARSKSRYVPFIADGGIGTVDPDMDKRAEVRERMRHDTRSINMALARAEAVMMGSYFNMFKEAAGPERTINGKPYKESWGEGSLKAKGLQRYDIGEGVRRAGIEEGTSNLIPCVGRLKPGIEKTALGVAMTLSNAGAANLADYRDLWNPEDI